MFKKGKKEYVISCIENNGLTKGWKLEDIGAKIILVGVMVLCVGQIKSRSSIDEYGYECKDELRRYFTNPIDKIKN